MAKRSETFFGKAAATLPGSDALPGWGIIGVVYWMWFFMHPAYMVVDLAVIRLNIKENAEAIAALVTGLTYFLGNLYDDLFWSQLKPSWTNQYTRRDGDAPFNIYSVLGISEGSYRVATTLLAAAGRDFWPKTVNELAKASRSLAVMAFFYIFVPTYGQVQTVYSIGWRLVAAAVAAGLGVWLYPRLKGRQVQIYYERTRDLIAEQTLIKTALDRLADHPPAEKLVQLVKELQAKEIITDLEVDSAQLFEGEPAVRAQEILDALRPRLKYDRAALSNKQLFFWEGELVSSATKG